MKNILVFLWQFSIHTKKGLQNLFSYKWEINVIMFDTVIGFVYFGKLYIFINLDMNYVILYNTSIRVCGWKSMPVAGKTIHISNPRGCEHGAA